MKRLGRFGLVCLLAITTVLVMSFCVDAKHKKHKNGNIYALCMPIPGEMDVYLQDKQEFNFFELEHYMGLEFLKNLNVVKETAIPDVYEITGDKVALAKKIRLESSPKAFGMFVLLFQEIDKLAGVQNQYLD